MFPILADPSRTDWRPAF